MTDARGSCVSPPAVPGLVLAWGSGAAQQPPEAPPRRGSARPRCGLSGVASARSRELISWTDRPSRCSCTTRARARSLAGALFGPGRPGGANICTLPARKSRSRLAMLARV